MFLSSRIDIVPGALLHNLKHNKVLHERVVIANVVVEDTPLVKPENRLEVEKLGKGFYTVQHASRLLRDAGRAAGDGRRPPLRPGAGREHRHLFIGRETLVQAEHSELARWRNWLYRNMARNAMSAARYYQPAAQPGRGAGTQITI